MRWHRLYGLGVRERRRNKNGFRQHVAVVNWYPIGLPPCYLTKAEVKERRLTGGVMVYGLGLKVQG